MSSPLSHLYNHEIHSPLQGEIRGAYFRFGQSQNQIAAQTGISQNAISKIVNKPTSRRAGHHKKQPQTRGRPHKFTEEEVQAMEKVLDEYGFEGRKLSWAELPNATQLDLTDKDWSWRTVQRALHQKDWHKCIACRKGWVTERLAKLRYRFAEDMLRKRPDPEDWEDVLSSDECHFGWGPPKKAYIIRKPGTRYCPECLQLDDKQPKEEDKKRFHVWAAVGYEFKSDLIFYDVPGNTNGKMSQQVYRDTILEPIVKPWMEKKSFVLEEDGDSGHGNSGRGKIKNIVQIWKEENGLQWYKNSAGSPDLAPIENCWLPPKQYSKKYPRWDDFSTRDLIQEGWEHCSQAYINHQMHSMPRRLNDVLKLDGGMTGW